MRPFLRPIRRFILLVDDQPEQVEGGIVIVDRIGCTRHDFYVAAIGTNENVEFDVGDRVIIEDPNAGRRVSVDGIFYRLVRVTDIIATME